MHLSASHICASPILWAHSGPQQQQWLKQADSFEAEEELKSHYGYNWIPFQPCERKTDLSPPWRKQTQNTTAVLAVPAWRGRVCVRICVCVCFFSHCAPLHMRPCCVIAQSTSIKSQDICASVKWIQTHINGEMSRFPFSFKRWMIVEKNKSLIRTI